MKKGHITDIFRRSLKSVLRIFPASLPTRIYRFISVVPPLKKIAHHVIRSFIPPSINIEEGTLTLNQKDVTVCGALALGAFEKRELETFRRSVRSDMTVVDIGANIGLYTVIASHRVGYAGKVYAFEPEQENFSLLTKNVEVNKQHNVVTAQTALSDTIGERALYLATDNKGHHSFAQDTSATTPISIHTNTLDNFLEKHSRPRVDVIKMDIEGAEPLALRGMKQTIAANPDIIIFTEIYPNAIRRLGEDPLVYLQTLDSYGLSIWVIDEDISTPTKIDPDNFESYLVNFPSGESFHNLYASRKQFPL